MYPLIRFAKEMLKYRNAPALGPMDVHVSTHRCWPWDIDPWIELNNGRTLTLYDLGRIPMAGRMGLLPALRKNKWGITVAGNSTRYRRRIKMFDKFTMFSRMVGWDHRFFYMEQTMWKKGECCNQMLLRTAVTSSKGIVDPALVIKALGYDGASPPLPDCVSAWIQAESLRPWPPQLPDQAKAHLPG
ncbi:acyl-CoA thioesterase [Paracoccus sp. 11-3]|uniref:Acyl-CoA thioesterase n=1 Tax=Paracoccus amoyensis TaxID=2760093 RepID=A0A926GFC2_9RHOB|nr:acyl-CoA thioesterase [Paracoccus amoyensis]MBC9246057.1 acyl-CoA thioesterase [Paracoccus amoyensis]